MWFEESSRGVDQRRMTSDCFTAWTFFATQISIAAPRRLTSVNIGFSCLALTSRLTQARNRDGSAGSSSTNATGVTVPEVWASHFGIDSDELESKLDKTPERMAIPMVPHPVGCPFCKFRMRDETGLRTDLGRTECTPFLLRF